MPMNFGSGSSFGSEMREIDLVMVCVQVSKVSTMIVRNHENHDKIHQLPEDLRLLEQREKLDLQVSLRKKEKIRDDGAVWLSSKWELIDHSTSSC